MGEYNMIQLTATRAAKLCLLCLVVLLNNTLQAQQTTTIKNLNLSGIENDTSSALTAKIITEAYRRIGVKVSIQYFPAARALSMSTVGKTDGELARILNIGAPSQSLVRVPVPYLSFKVRAFSIKPHVKINALADLAKYKSGVVNGILYSEKLTENSPRLKLSSPYQLLNMLVSRPDELDLVLLSEVVGQILIKNNFPEAGIKMGSHTLTKISVYHYLHESKKSLLPLIHDSLNEMLINGDILKMKKAAVLQAINVK